MDKPTLTFGSLFAGIGGIDLGLERANMRCEWQVENNEFCQKVLAKHWPDVARHGDVRNVGHHIGDIHTCYIPVNDIDVLAGGFPCQPHSQAGKRKASQDERDLWPEFYRLIRELEPRWVVAENVLGLLSSENGAFFGGILRDLDKAGYDARWQVLSAAQFGAPHLRERVVIVAYHTGVRSGAWWTESAEQCGTTIADRDGSSDVAHASSPEWWTGAERWCHVFDWANAGRQEAASGFEFCSEELANTSGAGRQEWDTSPVSGEQGHASWRKIAPGTGQLVEDSTSCRSQKCVAPERLHNQSNPSSSWATQSRLGRAINGIPGWLDRYRWPARPGQSQEAWEAPRVVVEKKINRTARLKGLGNAVIPALAEYIGRCIMAAEAESERVA